MTTKYITHILQSASFALVAAVTIVLLAVAGLLMAEPQIGHSQVTRDFTIRQTIEDETTFQVDPSNVTMSGNINGVTGGNATGTTEFSVRSNNSTGYYVTIDFGNAAGTYVGQYAMYGDLTGAEDIFDYRYGVGAEPDFGFTPEANASFAYTVTSTTPLDTDDSFAYTAGNVCNDDDGSQDNTADGSCWATPSSTQFRIVDVAGPSNGDGSAATSSITFRVNVPSGAVPIPSAETYTATATLSLFTQ